MKNNMRIRQLPALGGVAAVGALLGAPTPAQAQTQEFFACFVPRSGVVYRVNPPGSPGESPDLKDDCTGKKHVKFSWAALAVANGTVNIEGPVDVAGDIHASGILSLGPNTMLFDGANNTITTGTDEDMAILPGGTGNVGIGTPSPGAKLEVAGQVKITGGAPGTGKVLTSDAAGLASWQTPSAGAGDGHSLDAADGDPVDALFVDNDGNVSIGTGNVSIGTASLSSELFVVGRIRAIALGGLPAVRATTNSGVAIAGEALGTGPARAGDFRISNSSNAANALFAETDGLGEAGEFRINNTANSSAAVFARTFGLGEAGRFRIVLPSNSSAAVFAQTFGTGAGVRGVATGSPDGIGVVGDGGSVGVKGTTSSDANFTAGGKFENFATSGNNFGIEGIARSSSGVALRGLNTSSTGGTGLQAVATATSGGSIGVLGVVSSPDGTAGVFGTEDTGGKILSGVAGPAGGTEVFSVAGSGNMTAAGTIESTSGGFKFPDGTTQTTKAGTGAGDGHSLDAADGDPVDVVFVDIFGKVGIGTASPDRQLEVEKIVTGSEFQAMRLSNGSGQLNANVALELAASASNSPAKIVGISQSFDDQELAFFTTDNNTQAEAMRIVDDGNVGIGTTGPGSRLEVKGSGATSATSALNVTNSAGTSGLFVRDDGNVGIGTTTLGEKLTVAGTIETTSGGVKFPDGGMQTSAGQIAAFQVSNSDLVATILMIEVVCPAPFRVLGGGWKQNTTPTRPLSSLVSAFENGPVGNRKWRVRIRNTGGFPVAIGVTATCAPVTP